MTKFELDLLKAMDHVTFPVASPDKRFIAEVRDRIRSVRNAPPKLRHIASYDLTSKQHQYLCRIVVRYRKQLSKPCTITSTGLRASGFIEHPLVQQAREELAHYSHGRQPFEEELDTNPRDLDARLVYADWLAEHGFVELETAQRRMAATHVFPMLAEEQVAGLPLRWGIRTQLHPAVGAMYWHPTRAIAEAFYARTIALYSEDGTAIPATAISRSKSDSAP